MAEHDEVLDPQYDDEERDAERLASLRTFELVLRTREGSVWREKVVAHYWDNTTAAGHWNFFTVQPSGRTFISAAYVQAAVAFCRLARDLGWVR